MEVLFDNTQNDLTSSLIQIVREHPELAELLETWFMEYCGALSEREQNVIRQLLGQEGSEIPRTAK